MTATYSRAEMLALLLAMTADTPDRPDRRGQDELNHDMALEQQAEDRQWMRAHPTEAESEWAARRWAG